MTKSNDFTLPRRTQQLNVLLILIMIVFWSGVFGQKNILIESKIISVELDRNFNEKIQWLQAGQHSIVSFDPAVQPGIVVNGKICLKFSTDKTKFTKKQVTDPEFGTAIEAQITGIFEEGDLKIERKTKILFPDKFKDVVIFNSIYRNLGKSKIHIDSVFSQRILLKSQVAKPAAQPADFASFQGGINEWGRDYELIWLTPGFQQSNFQGIHRTRGPKGAEPEEFIGGGMPFIDIWNKEMGVAIMQLEKQPMWLSLPVNVRPDGTTEIAIVEKPQEKFGQKEWLNPGERFNTVVNAVVFHHLDYFDALKTYADLLRCRKIDIQKTSPEKAYEPYWKSWGLGMEFTQEKIFSALPELRKIGILTANLDDGWFDYYGDWNVNRSPGKFPNGEKDMISFVKKMHEEGFKTNLWWYPLGVSPKSKLAIEHPELLVQAEDGSFPADGRGVYQLCPAYQPALDYIQSLVEKFTTQWGYDGLYSDSRGLASVPPCYNKAHHHTSPLESFQAVPQAYKVVYETLQKYNKNALQEVCICATPHSPYNMPYYQIASASDPINLFQVRRRIKVEKAIHGPTFCVGDCYQVPKDEFDGYSCRESFESALGTGAQVTTFYKDLDSVQLQTWIKGVGKYRELELSQAEYLNLYDVAFDTPEIHVVRKGNELFYGIYAKTWSKKDAITLRGLDKGINYSITDFYHNKKLGTINGSNPVLNIDFTDYLLIMFKPVNN
jgi:alpha-galactosidase